MPFTAMQQYQTRLIRREFGAEKGTLEVFDTFVPCSGLTMVFRLGTCLHVSKLELPS